MATVAARSGPHGLHNSVFASVFPPTHHTTPTPEATPNIGTLASPDAPFGGFNLPRNPVDDVVTLNRVWSTATRFLSLPSELTPARRHTSNEEAAEALSFLLREKTTNKELLQWYLDEIRTHFRHFVLPELKAWEHPIPIDETRTLFSTTVKALQQAQSLYLSIPDVSHESDAFCRQLKAELHVLVVNSLPRQRIQKALASYLFQTMKDELDRNQQECFQWSSCQCQIACAPEALAQLQDVGLGGSYGERALAHAVHKFLEGPAIERRCFQVDWSNRSPTFTKVHDWTRDVFSPCIVRALAAITGDADASAPAEQFISAAMSSFGRLRTKCLFDYVSSWPASESAILDVREYLNAPGSMKAQLCSSFSEQMQNRLLHAGACTTEILSMYINVINVFKVLDNRGVLLEKVAIPIRSYLRGREDTVTVIASSLLADVDENGKIQSQDSDSVCVDISLAIAQSTVGAQDDRLLNWNDMEWVPDPIDAGPNYKSSKSDDVVAYVLGLFDTDDFIKALSSAFGDHLLHVQDTELVKETRLIELLKSRLDPSKLQQVEVMLKDIRDSVHLNKRINPSQKPRMVKVTPKELQDALPEDGITFHSLWALFKHRAEATELGALIKVVARKQNDLYFPKRVRLPPPPQDSSAPREQETTFEAKVLSSYFWPQLRDVDFRAPAQVQEYLDKYETVFANTTGQRKLAWKHGLGTTDVKIEMEDRTIEEDAVEIWKATILDAFASQSLDQLNALANDAESEGLTLENIEELLSMDEDYVQSGVNYWVGKRVLYEKSEGRFAVLERLDMDVEFIDDGSHLDLDSIPAVKSELAMLKENAPMFQNFIDGMLRNGGSKEISGMMGITNMLKMVMPNFTGGDDEVKWLLEDMQSRDVVQKSGEMWSVT